MLLKDKETKRRSSVKKEIQEKNTDNEKVETLILLDKESEIKLTPKQGTLTCFDIINKKHITIKFKKSKDNLIWNLLDGYLMINNIYKNQRLIAIELDSKNNAFVLTDKKLKAIEKKYKKYLGIWSMVHKNSFGIKGE